MAHLMGRDPEQKYQYVDRMLNGLKESLTHTVRGCAYQRLVCMSVLSINPVTKTTADHVKALIKVSRARLNSGDYYNGRIFIRRAIDLMIENEVY